MSELSFFSRKTKQEVKKKNAAENFFGFFFSNCDRKSIHCIVYVVDAVNSGQQESFLYIAQ